MGLMGISRGCQGIALTSRRRRLRGGMHFATRCREELVALRAGRGRKRRAVQGVDITDPDLIIVGAMGGEDIAAGLLLAPQ